VRPGGGKELGGDAGVEEGMAWRMRPWIGWEWFWVVVAGLFDM
jgi:hypothetical protein